MQDNKKSTSYGLYFLFLAALIIFINIFLFLNLSDNETELKNILKNQEKNMEKLDALESKISELPPQPIRAEECNCDGEKFFSVF